MTPVKPTEATVKEEMHLRHKYEAEIAVVQRHLWQVHTGRSQPPSLLNKAITSISTTLDSVLPSIESGKRGLSGIICLTISFVSGLFLLMVQNTPTFCAIFGAGTAFSLGIGLYLILTAKRELSSPKTDHLNELKASLEKRRLLMAQLKVNDNPVSDEPVQELSEEEKEKKRVIAEHYQDIANQFQSLRNHYKKVKICTNSKVACFFIDLFSCLGFKRTFEEVMMLPDLFSSISNGADLRKARLSEATSYKQL